MPSGLGGLGALEFPLVFGLHHLPLEERESCGDPVLQEPHLPCFRIPHADGGPLLQQVFEFREKADIVLVVCWNSNVRHFMQQG